MEPRTITELTRAIQEARDEWSQENIRHDRTVNDLQSRIRTTQEVLNRKLAGLDNELVERGMAVLEICGNYTNAGGESHSVINDAVRDLALNKGQKLKATQLGVKNFDRWYGQRSDHPPGYGPKHGWITFSVCLQRELRGDREITADETEAALYVLHNITVIEAARAEASAA